MNKPKVIKAIKSDAKFTYKMDSDGVETIEWLDGNPTNITDSDITAKWNEMNALWDVQYQRSKAYPDFGTQLDYIYHNGIEKWKTDVVDPVKTKYPKPS